MGKYFQRMWDCRYFWLSLVKMDIRTRYRGSALGLGWSLLQPLCFTLIICTVFGRIFQRNIFEFGPYVLCGISAWAFIITSAVQGCFCFKIAEMYIRQFPAPMAIYPLRLILAQGFHLLISLTIVIGLAAVLRGISNPLALVSLVPSLLLLFVLGWSLAACTGLLTLHFPDAKHMTELLFQGIFYLTPVMLTDDILMKIGMFGYYQMNPFGWFLRLLRQPILEGTFPSWKLYGATTVFAVGAMCLASYALRRLEKRIIFYL